MYEHEFLADPYKFELTDLGVILGMDWLAKYQAQNRLSKTKNHLKGVQWGESCSQREGLKEWSETYHCYKSPETIRKRMRGIPI